MGFNHVKIEFLGKNSDFSNSSVQKKNINDLKVRKKANDLIKKVKVKLKKRQ
jgi:hypothetical protein